MFMTGCATSSSGATRCLRAALDRLRWKRSLVSLVCSECATAAVRAPGREPAMKPVGKPDAGNPHVRFDERGGETGCLRNTAPLLDSTVKPFLLPPTPPELLQ